MSLNDPLDPEAIQPELPIPQPPPPAAPRSRSLRAQFGAVSPGTWIGLGIIGTLLVVIAIAAALIRTLSSAPTPTPTRAVPALSITPGTAVPGQRVTVSGFNLIPNDPVTIFLRDPARPSDPILQLNTATVSPNGSLAIEFLYPLEPRWARLSSADVIVQSASTGAYWTAGMTVKPGRVVVTPLIPTAVPFATWTPRPGTYSPPTWTPPAPTLVPPSLTPTPSAPPSVTPPPVITDWRGEYFDNPTLTGAPVVVRNDFDVKFNWERGAPDPRVPVDYFSARWTRALGFESKIYRFSIQCDDGARVWVDDNLIIDEWHAASPPVYTRDVSLSAGLHPVRIEFYEGVLDAYISLKIEPIDTFNGWKGEYFNNPFVGGAPQFIRDDAAVAFEWGANPPAAGLPAQRWSARWTRSADLAGGAYRFTLRADDGARLSIDGNVIINEWHAAAGQVYTRDVNLSPGTHNLIVEYYQDLGSANIWLTYQSPPIEIAHWRSEFYANDRWAGLPTLIRNDERLDFDWGLGAPDPLLPVDRFSARFTRSIELPAGEYQFDLLVDDGVRFYVDGVLLLDQIKEQAATPYSLRLTLAQGSHDFRIDYVEYLGQARLAWSRTPLSVTVTPAPTTSPAPTTAPNLPVINQFVITPTTVTAGGCVGLSWQVSGGTISARVLRGGSVVKDNLPSTGTATDCLTSPGVAVYRLEAINSVNLAVTRDVTVTAQTSAPTIKSFTASAGSLTVGQCVTLTWSTSGAATPIDLQVSGQIIGSNLPASGSAQHCPLEAGTKVYLLVITALPGGSPIGASVTVAVTAP